MQVRIYHPRKRAGISSCPQIEANAPKVVWAMACQFDSTLDGKAIMIASMIDEHTRQSLLNIVKRSTTAQRLNDELDKTFALWDGPPLVLLMDNSPDFISHVLQQFCRDRVGISCIPPGTPWNNRHIESFNNRLRKECLNRNHWTSLLEARVVIEDFKHDHNHRHRHSSLGYLTPAEYTSQCTPTTNRSRAARSTEISHTVALERGGPSIGDLSKTSIVMTTNRGVGPWGEVLGDNTVAATMLDRLLYRSVELNLDGDSYRLRDHNARSE